MKKNRTWQIEPKCLRAVMVHGRRDWRNTTRNPVRTSSIVILVIAIAIGASSAYLLEQNLLDSMSLEERDRFFRTFLWNVSVVVAASFGLQVDRWHRRRRATRTVHRRGLDS